MLIQWLSGAGLGEGGRITKRGGTGLTHFTTLFLLDYLRSPALRNVGFISPRITGVKLV
jgi:hypothetical protein